MRRPTKNQAEWTVLLAVLVAGFTINSVRHGFWHALAGVVIFILAYGVVVTVLTLARRLGR